jgi:hypothetical protein
MFVIRLAQWPLLILFIGVIAMAVSFTIGAWFNTDEYVFHLQR